jgi:hypothetical protein
MTINKADGKLRVCLSAKELALMLVSKFLNDLTSEIISKRLDKDDISIHIKKLANNSVDSHDYEYFASILDLYELFEKNCDFCFNLKSSFDFKEDVIRSLNDLTKHKDDPPDAIVLYKNNYFEFELKRYRDKLNVDKMHEFIKKKIILHYSERQNYLILLQSAPFSDISLDIFEKLHKKLIKEKNIPGIIGFSLNNDNEEMILIRIFPNLDISKRGYTSQKDRFAELLHSE